MPRKQMIISVNDDLDIWTESFGNPDHPACLLISGAGAPAKFWSDHFCSRLAEEFFFEIRFDHRDSGLSSSVDFEHHPYSVLDLAKDVIGVLYAYQIIKAYSENYLTHCPPLWH